MCTVPSPHAEPSKGVDNTPVSSGGMTRMVVQEYSARHPTPPPPKLISNEAIPPGGTVTGQDPHDGCSGGDGAGTLTADGTGSVVARSKLLATTRPSADTKLTSGCRLPRAWDHLT